MGGKSSDTDTHVPAEFDEYEDDVSDIYFFIDDIDHNWTPFCKLWFGIVERAYLDCIGPASLDDKRTARNWIFAKDQDEWSFIWLCTDAIKMPQLILLVRNLVVEFEINQELRR